MKLKPILSALAVAVAAIAQPALAGFEFTQNDKGEVTHYNGIALPPIQTVEEARAQAQKEIAAAQRASEAQQTATAANLKSEISNLQLFYTGKPFLEESGQYLFLFRHYDPGLSRWTTADPSGFPDGANNYLHVNNWYGAIDDTGLQIIKFAYSTYIETAFVEFGGRTFNGGEKTWQILTVDTSARSIASHSKGTGITYEFDSLGGSVI